MIKIVSIFFAASVALAQGAPPLPSPTAPPTPLPAAAPKLTPAPTPARAPVNPTPRPTVFVPQAPVTAPTPKPVLPPGAKLPADAVVEPTKPAAAQTAPPSPVAQRFSRVGLPVTLLRPAYQPFRPLFAPQAAQNQTSTRAASLPYFPAILSSYPRYSYFKSAATTAAATAVEKAAEELEQVAEKVADEVGKVSEKAAAVPAFSRFGSYRPLAYSYPQLQSTVMYSYPRLQTATQKLSQDVEQIAEEVSQAAEQVSQKAATALPYVYNSYFRPLVYSPHLPSTAAQKLEQELEHTAEEMTQAAAQVATSAFSGYNPLFSRPLAYSYPQPLFPYSIPFAPRFTSPAAEAAPEKN